MKIKSPDISSQNYKNLNIKDKKETDGSGISKNFQRLLNEVNKQQHYAENKQVDLLTSNNKDIHGTMIALEKADISMRLMLQVRN